MSKDHSPEKVKEYSDLTLGKIQELNVPLTPEMFTLWYAYFSSENAELTHTISMLIKKNKNIDYSLSLDLYNSYLNNEDEIKNVRSTSSQIQNAIQDVNTLVGDVNDSTQKYQQSLINVKDQLDGKNPSAIEVTGIVSDVVDETGSIIEKTKQLEDKLNLQTQLILSLEHDLNRVQKEAMTDGLTNIANRKAFDLELKKLIETAQNENDENATFSLVLMDIDHFKKFNDTYGHQVGDQVLRLVAKTLVDGVKGRDFIARYGGEEFAILLPMTDQHSGHKVANSLRENVSKKKIVNRNTGDDMGKITLSGGITEFFPEDDVDKIIERADKALYESKEKGRNKITIARVKVA